jgi:hypothetical protein
MPRSRPHGASWARRAGELLRPGFELVESLPVPPAQSLPVFQGKEVWQVWRRRL